jgi:hypothetical protein
MKKLTPATERRLMECINLTTDNVNDGMHPNAAIIKAASAAGVAPGEVKLVVHAYNTGRTARQRVEGDDPFEKSAEFEMADLPTILDEMYPDNVKKASVNDFEISPEYSFSPKPMLARLGSREKRAIHVDWKTLGDTTIVAPAAYPSDPKAAMQKASANADRLKTDVEEHRRKAASAFDDMAETFTGLTGYFRRPDARPIPVVKEAVMLIHGGKGEEVMDQLIKVTPSLMKLANHKTGQSLLGTRGREKMCSVDSLDATDEPFPAIARLLGQVDTYKRLKQAWSEKQAEAKQQAEVLLRPFAVPAVSLSILGPSLDDEMAKAAGFNPMGMMGSVALMQNMVGRPAANRLKAPEESQLVESTLQDLTDPAHEAKIRGINTQAMLQDLVLNDPVISGYDPEEVSTAYNDLVQISPSLADQKLPMQAMLRKQLQQGQLDQFEVDQLMDTENKARQRNQMQVKGVSPDGSII